jgi:hypothetical protein
MTTKKKEKKIQPKGFTYHSSGFIYCDGDKCGGMTEHKIFVNAKDKDTDGSPLAELYCTRCKKLKDKFYWNNSPKKESIPSVSLNIHATAAGGPTIAATGPVI